MIAKEMTLTTKAYQIIELPQTHDFPGISYVKGAKQAHGILNESGKTIAYAWYEIQSDNSLYMDRIEVLEKEKGHGTAIVRHLFNTLNIDRITGSVLLEEGMRPYYFWESLGAVMNVEDEDHAYDYYIHGDDVTFILHKENTHIGSPIA